MEAAIGPDEAVFRRHLDRGGFRSGASAGRWRTVAVAWPYAVFGVSAVDGVECGLRFDCTDYPRTPPTARPWDLDRDAPLAGRRARAEYRWRSIPIGRMVPASIFRATDNRSRVTPTGITNIPV